LDLFAPNADVNDYGSRSKKKLKTGVITQKSYIPAGLTKEQYANLRKKEQKQKEENYKYNVKKAGVFQDYTDFYTKRGTDVSDAWSKSVTNGHTMAKTKYDWSGDTGDLTKGFESFVPDKKKKSRFARKNPKN